MSEVETTSGAEHRDYHVPRSPRRISLAGVLRWSMIGAATTLGVTIALLLAVSLILAFQVNAVSVWL